MSLRDFKRRKNKDKEFNILKSNSILEDIKNYKDMIKKIKNMYEFNHKISETYYTNKKNYSSDSLSYNGILGNNLNEKMHEKLFNNMSYHDFVDNYNSVINLLKNKIEEKEQELLIYRDKI